MSTAPQTESIPRIAIAGAAGFVGAALAERLEDRCAVLALGRRFSKPPGADLEAPPDSPGFFPRRCDLFSVRQTENALRGADIAVYLVHSMSPNARLTQGAFEDLDLLLADNFGRAAAQAGVKRIVYLGGLLPSDPSVKISKHLASRREVERALGSHGVSVTAVRAGLIVGTEGSSLNLLVRLVERLPLMICPSWTSSKTQPIALEDVLAVLDFCCLEDETAGRVCEVGGPDIMTYREMMQATARVLGRKRPMIPVPLVTPALSELWVSIVTGSSRSLVRPLIESLRHPMVVEDGWLQARMNRPGTPFNVALEDSVQRLRGWKRPIARSVQRFDLPPGRDIAWVAEEYPRWLERRAPWLLRIERVGDDVRMGLRPFRQPFLVLKRRSARPGASLGESSSGSSLLEPDEKSEPELGRYLLTVEGGRLARSDPQGIPRLEFRATPDGEHVLAALQDYEPSLPWWLYAATQAPIHRIVMAAYRKFLSDESRRALR